MGELLHRVHAEGQPEIFGQPLDGHEQVAGQSALDGRLVPEIDLVAFEEGSLVGLGDVQCGALPVRLECVPVGLEERHQAGGDGIGLAGGLEADVVERGDPAHELRMEFFQCPVDHFLLLPGEHHQVHETQVVVASPLAVVSEASVQKPHHLFLSAGPEHGQQMARALHQGRDDQVAVLPERGQNFRFEEAIARLLVHIEPNDERAGQDFGEFPSQRFDARGVEQALGPLDDRLGVRAALALFLGDAGDAGQDEGRQVLGHLFDLDVVEDDERVLRAVGIVGRVGALLLLGLAVEQGRDQFARGGLARSRWPFEPGHRPRAGEVDQEKTGEP